MSDTGERICSVSPANERKETSTRIVTFVSSIQGYRLYSKIPNGGTIDDRSRGHYLSGGITSGLIKTEIAITIGQKIEQFLIPDRLMIMTLGQIVDKSVF